MQLQASECSLTNFMYPSNITETFYGIDATSYDFFRSTEYSVTFYDWSPFQTVVDYVSHTLWKNGGYSG